MKSLIEAVSQYGVIRQISLTAICNTISILAQLAIIPLFISTLGAPEYGLWVTLFSLINWLSLIEAGLGSGIRNKLSHNLSAKNHDNVRQVVTTGFYAVTLIIIIFYCILLMLHENYNFSKFFPKLEVPSLNIVILLTITSFMLIIHGKLAQSIAAAYHKAEFSAIINLLQNIGLLIIITLMKKELLETGFVNFMYAYMFLCFIIQTLPLLTMILIMQGRKFLSFADFDIFLLKSLFAVSYRFLILQASAVVLYSTDAFILQFFFGPIVTAEYGAAAKYFGISVLLTTIIGGPLWSIVASEKAQNKANILKLLLSKILLFLMVICLLILLLCFLQAAVFTLWIPELVNIDPTLLKAVALYSLLQCILFVEGSIINGSGFLFLQSTLAPLAALFNLILSLTGVQIFNLGFEWVIFSTIIANIPSLIILGVQSYRILNNTALGIWAR